MCGRRGIASPSGLSCDNMLNGVGTDPSDDLAKQPLPSCQ
jgi:hypothetical protein